MISIPGGELHMSDAIYQGQIETAELLPAPTHVSRIEMSKLWNDGDYENTRISITVDIGLGDDPLKQFRKLRYILGNLRAKSGVSKGTYEMAKEVLALDPATMTKR